MAKDKPTHKQCRQCGEWFTLKPNANPRQKFCTVSCSAKWRNAQPRWKKAHSQRMKASTDPEAMRERARAIWRDPELRARLTEKARRQSNTEEHRARMAEHNKRLWKDEGFRKRHVERSRERTAKQWNDPAFREKMSEQSAELNKQRWADPTYRERTARSIRIALQAPLEKKRRSKALRELAQRPENRARSSRQMKERWSDPETRARMSADASERAKRKWRTDPAYRKKKLAVLRATIPKNRVRMSELNKKLWADPAYVARRKAWWTPERRAAQVEANKKRWSDPAYKARVAAKISKAKKGKPSAGDRQNGAAP